ncbi:Retrotransposon protein [Zea mays]|uniref:Retrotransposon protein n=1 Tax=Zea mays TaxID=4577 RepID=A0A1D6F5W2_MAIZE|nr:Retrotransposon protein [Zea mays]
MSSAAASSSPAAGSEGSGGAVEGREIAYVSYGGEHHLPLVMSLVDEELSEPYSIFTYRYFVYLWPQLTFLVHTPPLLSPPPLSSAPSRITPW